MSAVDRLRKLPSRLRVAKPRFGYNHAQSPSWAAYDRAGRHDDAYIHETFHHETLPSPSRSLLLVTLPPSPMGRPTTSQDKVRRIPKLGVEVPAEQKAEARTRAGRAGEEDRRAAGQQGPESCAALARRADLSQGGPRCARLSGVLRRQGDSRRLHAAGGRERAGRRARRGQRPVDHRPRPRRARLRLEDRRQRAAVRAGRARVVHAPDGGPLPARHLVARPGRNAQRAELHPGAAHAARAVHARRTRSSCIPTAATATPTSSPARSTCSKRSTRCAPRYRVDDDRTLVRGFSMGGAGCWQFAVHYADRWFAANPGAGFSETPLFLKVFQQEKLSPTWYEKKLWRWYDCPDWALNLINCPTVAYSGELDNQKQAADVMAEAMAKRRLRLNARHRSRHETLLRAQGGRGGREPAGEHRARGPRATAPAGAPANAHVALQPQQLGNDRRPGRTLGELQRASLDRSA